MKEIQDELWSLADDGYRRFQCKLMPTVTPEIVIGVRTPLLRTMAKQLWKSELSRPFMEELPHKYYEENNLHAFCIEQITDFDKCISALRTFLPYVNNWATCDSLSPRVLSKYPTQLRTEIENWLIAPTTFEVRFGIKMLMTHYLGTSFSPDILERVASIRSDEYYVNMMIAWFFATALAKQPHATLPYLQERRLSPWVHAKAIRKAIESDRISDEQKQYLRTLI